MRDEPPATWKIVAVWVITFATALVWIYFLAWFIAWTIRSVT